MVGKPAEPAREGHQEIGQEAQNQAERAQERFGPVTITRLVKDDGRALIVYARDPRDPA
jgi:hypothetical protein